MSAAMADHSDACPRRVRTTNVAFTAREKAMFWRTMASVRR